MAKVDKVFDQSQMMVQEFPLINKVTWGWPWLTLDFEDTCQFRGYFGNGGEFPEFAYSSRANRSSHAG